MSCSLPETYEKLCTLVQSLQIHHHSQTCRRKGTYRLNYPKPPSPYTIISHEPEDNSTWKLDFAVKILTAVKQALESKDLPTDILQEILAAAHVTLDDKIQALFTSKHGQSVILKRQPFEQYVNYYSPTILKTWQADMDIQYVTDAYACVMYITFYILKAEKGLVNS